jgi:hypothetical protein
MTDIVRVLRLIEYVGPRDWVEATLRSSIHGQKALSSIIEGKTPTRYITAVTLTQYPEILNKANSQNDPL